MSELAKMALEFATPYIPGLIAGGGERLTIPTVESVADGNQKLEAHAEQVNRIMGSEYRRETADAFDRSMVVIVWRALIMLIPTTSKVEREYADVVQLTKDVLRCARECGTATPGSMNRAFNLKSTVPIKIEQLRTAVNVKLKHVDALVMKRHKECIDNINGALLDIIFSAQEMHNVAVHRAVTGR